MPVHQVFTKNPNLADLDYARQLGQRLWSESDLQLDFSHIESVTPEFATELCRTIIQLRSSAVLQSVLLTQTMAPAVQASFFPALMAAISGTPPVVQKLHPLGLLEKGRFIEVP